MDRLIVTSAKHKLATDILDNEPLAGDVFVTHCTVLKA